MKQSEIQRLAEHARLGYPMLSVYLNTDRADPVNLNRRFEDTLKNMLRAIGRGLSEPEKEKFDADCKRIRDYMKSLKQETKSAVFFSDSRAGLFRVYELSTTVNNRVYWEESAVIKPLLEIMEEHERYAVVLTDKAHSRVMSVHMGAIERDMFIKGPDEVRHLKDIGSDTPMSQMNLQRRADEYAKKHIKHVRDEIRHLDEVIGFDHLVLSGTEEATELLKSVLPKGMVSQIVGEISLPVNTPKDEVLRETLKVARKHERREECRLVENLVIMASKQGQAVLGLQKTLEALHHGQIAKLVYENAARRPSGRQCRSCSSIFMTQGIECPYCASPSMAVNDLMEAIARRVVELGGVIEQVRDCREPVFEKADRIGAFLRFPITDGLR